MCVWFFRLAFCDGAVHLAGRSEPGGCLLHTPGLAGNSLDCRGLSVSTTSL
jgi:hypothetical protein